MGKPRGGFTGGPQAKPASELDIRLGHGLLQSENSEWPRYLVVTTPSAYEAAKSHLAREPAAHGLARSLDWAHLGEVADALPDDAELVIGLGAGTALDASKYVALAKGLPVILVPTAVSTGAIIHGVFARFEGHTLVGPPKDFPWIDAARVVVDYDVVLKAPFYLNTAGLGDVLCGYSGIAEWRRNARLGVGPAYDEAVASAAEKRHDDTVAEFTATFAQDGALTAESVRLITKALQERDDSELDHPGAIMADHDFLICTEEVNNEGWVHGELAALGAVVVAWHCEESPKAIIERLDACKIRWRPGETGLPREALKRGLEYFPTFSASEARGRDVHSILRDAPIVGKRFDDLWKYLQGPS